MKRSVQLAVMCGLMLVCGSGAEKNEKKKEAAPVPREWLIQHFRWQLTDEAAIKAWKEKKDRTVPKDVRAVASIRVFRRDNEKSVVIVHLAKGTCGATVLPLKDDKESSTLVQFFYASGDRRSGIPDTACAHEIDDDDLATGKPILLGASSHGVLREKGGGYKSFTAKVILVTVKKCDDNTAAKAFSAHVEPWKRKKD
jgi:hypothetical protein